MEDVFEKLASLDKVIHEPARLSVMTVLAASGKAGFQYLLSVTGLSKGNLSSHIIKLEESGFVEVQKSFSGKKPVTTVRITPKGKKSIQEYWDSLDKLSERVRAWKPQHNNRSTS